MFSDYRLLHVVVAFAIGACGGFGSPPVFWTLPTAVQRPQALRSSIVGNLAALYRMWLRSCVPLRAFSTTIKARGSASPEGTSSGVLGQG